LKSARSARSDNGQGQELFDTVERHLLKTSREIVFGNRLPVNTRHIAFRDTPLHTAAAQDQRHAPHCALLLDSGADSNAEDRHLATPLHIAAAAGHNEAAKKLIKCGADVCKEDRWRGTPLHRAAQNGQTALAQLLLQSGAATGISDEWGSTPLHRAVGKSQLAVAEQLLSSSNPDALGANAEDRAGHRPLHIAASNGDYAMVRLLLEYGVDSLARSRVTGKTPEECARDRGHTSVVALLQNDNEWVSRRQPAVKAVA
jgi:ankyrin repeat protein